MRRGRRRCFRSIPTTRPRARAAVRAGAEIVNDVSGLVWDDGMPDGGGYYRVAGWC